MYVWVWGKHRWALSKKAFIRRLIWSHLYNIESYPVTILSFETEIYLRQWVIATPGFDICRINRRLQCFQITKIKKNHRWGLTKNFRFKENQIKNQSQFWCVLLDHFSAPPLLYIVRRFSVLWDEPRTALAPVHLDFLQHFYASLSFRRPVY